MTLRKGRIVMGFILVTCVLVVAQDLVTSRSLMARTTIAAIDVYRAIVSPRISGVVTCRFKPSCSAYGRASIVKHGAIVGGAKTVWRIARCNPMTPMGTVDLP